VQAFSNWCRPTASSRCAVVHTRGGHGKHICWQRGSPGAMCMHTNSRDKSIREGRPYTQRNGQHLIEVSRCDWGARRWRQSGRHLRWVVHGQRGSSVAAPLRQAAWSLLPRAQSRRQPRHGLRSRPATTLLRHTPPSRNVSRRPIRPGRRLPRRPERPHTTPCQAPTPWDE
jgi:hypothetical protein